MQTTRRACRVFGWKSILPFVFLTILLNPMPHAKAQVVSPLQGGHYSPVVSNIRDMAHASPGLYFLWYNVYFSSNKYVDRNGNEFKSIRLDQVHPALPNIDVSLDLDGITSVPTLF